MTNEGVDRMPISATELLHRPNATRCRAVGGGNHHAPKSARTSAEACVGCLANHSFPIWCLIPFSLASMTNGSVMAKRPGQGNATKQPFVKGFPGQGRFSSKPSCEA